MVKRLRLVEDFKNSNCKHSDNQKNDKIARFVFANHYFLVEIIGMVEIKTVAVKNSVENGIDDWQAIIKKLATKFLVLLLIKFQFKYLNPLLMFASVKKKHSMW